MLIKKRNYLSPYKSFKSFNADKNVNNSNIQSNNNFTTPEDIFNRDNEKELAQNPDICISKKIITPSPTLYMADPKLTPRRI